MQFNNSILLAIRRALRATGLAPPLARLIAGGGGYEQRFHDKLIASIRAGDTVWDVGANVGHYTVLFAELTGDGGRVFAFEPSPTNSKRLVAATAALAKVKVLQVALSDQHGTANFAQGDDELGATSRVLTGAVNAKEAGSIGVEMTTGDSVVVKGLAAPPNVVKIDVEGHELEVLHGLSVQLAGPAVREVFIEVHFGLLEEQGRSEVPGEIVRLLTAAGYKSKWIDPSHLHATRTLS